MINNLIANPLSSGKIATLVRVDSAPPNIWESFLTIESDSVLVSVFVSSLAAGSLNVEVLTETESGREVQIIQFPEITGPTSELLLRKAAISLSSVRVRAVTTGTCTFEIRARAIAAGSASVKIESATSWSVTQTSVTTTPAGLLGVSLNDRSGILVKNYQGGGVLFIAESLAKIGSGDSYPLQTGESLAMDLAAGQDVYAVASSGSIDVRIIEAGAA